MQGGAFDNLRRWSRSRRSAAFCRPSSAAGDAQSLAETTNSPRPGPSTITARAFRCAITMRSGTPIGAQPFPRLTDCTWPGLIPWFAVSSGTTTGATKYIPVSREMHRSNVRAGAEMVTHHLANRPESRLFAGRVFMLGGSTGLVRQSRGVFSGDLSGIEASAMPGWARLRYFPPRDLESIADWQIKIDRFAERSLDEEITAVVGTPSWLLIFSSVWRKSPAPGGAARRAGSPISIPRSNCCRTAASPGRPIATASPPCSKAAAPRHARSIRRAKGSSPSPTVRTARASGFCSIPGSFTSSSPSISWAARSLTAAGSATSSRA